MQQEHDAVTFTATPLNPPNNYMPEVGTLDWALGFGAASPRRPGPVRNPHHCCHRAAPYHTPRIPPPSYDELFPSRAADPSAQLPSNAFRLAVEEENRKYYPLLNIN